MPIVSTQTKHEWWNDLRHGGMLISPALLDEVFAEGVLTPSDREYSRLRDRYNAFEVWLNKTSDRERGEATTLHQWLDAVLEDFLGLPASQWSKGNQISTDFTVNTIFGERLRPNRLLFGNGDRSKPSLIVWVDKSKKVGFGRGRHAYGKLLQYLRARGEKLGLVTNGVQFRLCYAGLDHDAWAEWDASTWFEEGELRRQLYGFYTLLGPDGLKPRDDYENPILNAIETSRTKQVELSDKLGEQVREAVEIIIDELNNLLQKHPELSEVIQIDPGSKKSISDSQYFNAIYQAATRVIMRIVVVLFAEARELLPRSIVAYDYSYGIEGLFEQLRMAESHEGFRSLEERFSAWPRLLSLSRLIYNGSPHPDLNIPKYGGVLFRPGDPDSNDPVLRVLAVLEDARMMVPDSSVYQILKRLKIGQIKIRRGRTSALVSGPIDFYDLGTEFIGIMYEGLLDYGVKRSDQTMVELKLGRQPLLPLQILEDMTDKNIKDMLGKLSKEKVTATVPDSEELEEQAEEEDDLEAEIDPEVEEQAEETVETESEEEPDLLTDAEKRRERAVKWAERAVEAAGLVKKPKKKGMEYYYEQEKVKKARSLIGKVVEKGELYLSRWGGTRKGSGTFYTKPGLTVPTTHRTLEPLLHQTTDEGLKVPKTPEEILALKVCDPACGSASFLVAALRYLTDVLFDSLKYHRKIAEEDGYQKKTLPLGKLGTGEASEDILPCPPSDDKFEERVKARLRRYVVERCLYGVDLNPMAVELARLSLWIETMDPTMPLGFLDHKIKVGNSLVGCWFDRFQEYPLAAWLREGGDKNYTTGVHFKQGEWTKAIKKTFNDRVKPELVSTIRSRGPQTQFPFIEEGAKPEQLHQESLQIFERLHRVPIDQSEQRESKYRESFLDNAKLQPLKKAFDTWCAVWFWPADELGDHLPAPFNFYRPRERTQYIVKLLSDQLRFFHWELEFPDVFAREGGGFDALLGNPPWDISKPNSKEFFSNYDPIYRTYGKQEAIAHQKRLFESDPEIEKEWLSYNAHFRAMTNWVKHASYPFGDPKYQVGQSVSFSRRRNENTLLHESWRTQRSKHKGFADPGHPFRYQGIADLNTYKMFLELFHALLKDNGRIGVIVPSGIYTDKGTTDLRSLLIDRCNWEWLFGFENRKGIFDIHRSAKFCPLVIEKGRETKSINTVFMRHDLADWEKPEQHSISYARDQVEKFSPKNMVLLELRSKRDQEILERIYNGSILLGDQSLGGWRLEYAAEFHMTTDSKLFHPRPWWEDRGYKPDAYGRWIGPDGEIALPLYEGRMIEQFDFSAKGWVRGKGRQAVWRDLDFSDKRVEPQYIIESSKYTTHSGAIKGHKVGFMAVGSATNRRSMYAAVVYDSPCGNSIGILQPGEGIAACLALSASLNSYVYDYALRNRLGGLNLNYFVIEETPLPEPKRALNDFLLATSASLGFAHEWYSPAWLELVSRGYVKKNRPWKFMWAVTLRERLRLRSILDAMIAELYGLEYDDLAWILRDDPSDPKGFWRVDKYKPKELRHTTLTLVAFQRLKEVGLEEFCKEDWQFPKEIAEKLGPRYLEWQKPNATEEEIKQSWEECEMHARNILGEEEFKKLIESQNYQGDNSPNQKSGIKNPRLRLD